MLKIISMRLKQSSSQRLRKITDCEEYFSSMQSTQLQHLIDFAAGKAVARSTVES